MIWDRKLTSSAVKINIYIMHTYSHIKVTFEDRALFTFLQDAADEYIC